MVRAIVILLALVVVIAGGSVLALNMGFLHTQLESRAAQSVGGPVSLGRILILPKWPLTLSVGVSHLDHPAATISWQTLRVELSNFSPPYRVSVFLLNPRVVTKPASPSAPAQPADSGGAAEAGHSVGTPIHLKLNIENGEVDDANAQVRALKVQFEQRILYQSSARFDVSANVQAKVLPVWLPVSLESDDLTLSPLVVKTTSLKIRLGGLNGEITGGSLLAEQRQRWSVKVEAPDLSTLPQAPMNLPADKWKGSLNLKTELIKEGLNGPWQISGEVIGKNISAVVNWQKDGARVQGPMQMDLTARFSNPTNMWVVSELVGQLNLTEASVSYPDMLIKAAKVPLTLKIQAGGDSSRLKIENFIFQVAALKGEVTGDAVLKDPIQGQLKFAIQPTSLTGLDQIFPPLKKSPVVGELALAGEVRGPLAEPMQAHVRVTDFRLRNFSGNLDYNSPGSFKAQGPVRGTLQGVGELDRGQVRNVTASGAIDFLGTAMVIGPLRKEAKQDLKLDFSVKSGGLNAPIQFERMNLNGFFGRIQTTGTYEGRKSEAGAGGGGGGSTAALTHIMNMNLNFQPLLLTELRLAMPEMRDTIPPGQMRGQLKLVGNVENSKPWNEWPLKVTGQLNIAMPEYKVASEPANPAKPNPGKDDQPPPASRDGAAAESEPLLPPGALTSQLNLKLNVSIQRVIKDKLVINGVETVGALDDGHFRGVVNLKQIFGGSLNIEGLDVPLLVKRPSVRGHAKWQGLIIEDALAFSKPEYKNMASGKTVGTTHFVTLMPAEADFMSALKANGSATFEPVTLSTVKIGQMINDMAKKIPLVKIPPTKVEPFKGTVKIAFDLESQNLQIQNFEGYDADGSELRMKGKVNLASMQGDMVGDFFWAKPQVKGCLLEGSVDGQGRMAIPLSLRGDLMSPNMDTLADVATKLGGKALECEKKKAIESIKKDGGKKLEEEGRKLLKGILGK